MSEQFSDLEGLREERKMCKEWIAHAEMLTRLENNPDFKTLFGEWLFKDECIRLVLLRGVSNKEQEASVDKQIAIIGGLRDKFRIIHALGEKGKADLAAIAETEIEILKETDGTA